MREAEAQGEEKPIDSLFKDFDERTADKNAANAKANGNGGIARDWRGNEAKLGSQIACAASEPLFEQALISLRRSAI